MCTHCCTAPQRLFARTFDAAGVLACDIDDGILFMQVGRLGVQDLSKGKERSPFRAQLPSLRPIQSSHIAQRRSFATYLLLLFYHLTFAI